MGKALLSVLVLAALSGCNKGPAPSTGRDAATEVGDAGEANSGDAGQTNPAGSYALMSLNMHCLKLDPTSFTTNQARMAAIADAMAAEGVVAAALQEVCKSSTEDALALLLAELKRATNKDWSSQWLETHEAWVGTPDQADEGVAVIAETALTNTQQITYYAQGALQRKAVGAAISGLDNLILFSVHLDDADATVRAMQARETAPVTVTLSDPSLNLVVAGDFNDVAGSDPLAAMTTFGFVDFTGAEAASIIDRIFVHRGAALEVLLTKTIFDGTTYPVVTDHPEGAVLAIVRAKSPVAVTRTSITASVDVGLGNSVFVRGDTAPLNWNWGWRATIAKPPDQWHVVFTELSEGSAFNYKCVKDDVTWQTGSNASGVGGQDNSEQPTFP